LKSLTDAATSVQNEKKGVSKSVRSGSETGAVTGQWQIKVRIEHGRVRTFKAIVVQVDTRQVRQSAQSVGDLACAR